jgi:hypothetical protein
MDAPATEYCANVGWRVWTAGSNVFYAGALVYLLARVRPVAYAVVPAVFTTLLILFSTMYHVCLRQSICHNACAADISTLRLIDTMFATGHVAVALAFGFLAPARVHCKRIRCKRGCRCTHRPTRFALAQLLLYSFVMGATAAVNRTTSTEDPAQIWYYIAICAIAVIAVVPLRVGWSMSAATRAHFFRFHFHPRPLALSFVLLSIGVLFNLLDIHNVGETSVNTTSNAALNEHELSALYHGLWHVFTGAALYFGLRVFDGNGDSLWTLRAMRPGEDDIAALDDVLMECDTDDEDDDGCNEGEAREINSSSSAASATTTTRSDNGYPMRASGFKPLWM